MASKRPSRAQRWHKAASDALYDLQELEEIRQEFQDWNDNLPENLQSSTLGEKLQAVCDIDLQEAIVIVEEAEGADLPLGWGRD